MYTEVQSFLNKLTVRNMSKMSKVLHATVKQRHCTKNVSFTQCHYACSGKCNSLTDGTFELIDPTPNIHTLFVQFNLQFFWSTLDSVEVKWSNRMTSCAGVCSFRSRNKQCVITLSAPLLKLRPRKDLVETLLHEMIHAYLFLTNNDRDRDGHGPNFCKHMRRINSAAGTNITIYHTFHEEVKHYQQHWWKCNGPCQYKPPFFGMVCRAMNRAPGPWDFWWAEHRRNCSGQYIKIKEPENYKSGPKKSNTSKASSKKNDKSKLTDRNITDWFTKKTLPTVTPRPTAAHTATVFNQSNNDRPSTSKSNNSTNSIHTVNDFHPSQSPLMGSLKKPNFTHSTVRTIHDSSKRIETDDADNIAPKNSMFSCYGVLGGSHGGQSNLLTKFQHLSNSSNRPHESASTTPLSNTRSSIRSANNSSLIQRRTEVSCPACNTPISLTNIHRHVDTCLMSDHHSLIDEINNNVDNNNDLELEEVPRIIRSSRSGVSASVRSSGSEVSTIVRNGGAEASSLLKRSTEQGHDEVDASLEKRSRLLEPSDDGHVTCPVCNGTLPAAEINRHLDECLEISDTACKMNVPSTSRAADNNSIISIDDSYRNSGLDDYTDASDAEPSTSTTADASKTADCKQKCLVCNVTLAAGVSLNDHLEECIGNLVDEVMINNDTVDDDVALVENDTVDRESKYPCPVCMQMITENLMNQHLDMCLKDE